MIHPPNNAAVTLIDCLTGTVSFVHFRFGAFKLQVNPKAAIIIINKTTVNGSRTTKTAAGFKIHSTQIIRNVVGIRLNMICKPSFAFKTCQPDTGSTCKIQMFFPSRETDGAAISFIVVSIQIAAVATRAIRSSYPINIIRSESTVPFFTSNITAAKRINTIPNPQFNI